MLLLLLFLVASVLGCSPGTPFYPRSWEHGLEVFPHKSDKITPSPGLPSVASGPPSVAILPFGAKRRETMETENAESFLELYRRLEQQNLQHLIAVEPQGIQQPLPWPRAL